MCCLFSPTINFIWQAASQLNKTNHVSALTGCKRTKLPTCTSATKVFVQKTKKYACTHIHTNTHVCMWIACALRVFSHQLRFGSSWIHHTLHWALFTQQDVGGVKSLPICAYESSLFYEVTELCDEEPWQLSSGCWMETCFSSSVVSPDFSAWALQGGCLSSGSSSSSTA